MNWRMLPSQDPRYQTRIANGRSYSGAPGQVRSVPDFDGRVLQANGWTFISLSGPTSARPKGDFGAFRGAEYFDETLGIAIVHDGVTWRDATLGQAV